MKSPTPELIDPHRRLVAINASYKRESNARRDRQAGRTAKPIAPENGIARLALVMKPAWPGRLRADRRWQSTARPDRIPDSSDHRPRFQAPAPNRPERAGTPYWPRFAQTVTHPRQVESRLIRLPSSRSAWRCGEH